MHRLLIVMLLFGSSTLHASDLMRELRVAEVLKRNHVEGEWVELPTSSGTFIALQENISAPRQRGAAILLHDVGGQPDEVGLIQQLLSGLPASGWHLLSLQMPIASANANAGEYRGLVSEAAPRIEAAVAHLKQLGFFNVVLIGHGLGAAMAIDYMAAQPAAEIEAMVMVGVRWVPPDEMALAEQYQQLAKITVPLLDLYGSRDLPAVISSAKGRSAAGKSGSGEAYRQSEMMGADHRFRGMEQMLVADIAKWIGRVAPGSEVVEK